VWTTYYEEILRCPWDLEIPPHHYYASVIYLDRFQGEGVAYVNRVPHLHLLNHLRRCLAQA